MGSIGVMNTRGVFRVPLLLSVLLVAWQPIDGVAQQRDGQHDFDWEIGTWKTHLKRRVHPLTGSNEWVEYEGTTVVRKIWDGRANLVELEVHGPAGRIEGLSLRLYNPESRQWSLNFANVSGGTLFVPTIGEFRQGRGEFFNQETLNGRAILVRFVISDVTPDSARFEQSFSDDGGKTWEANWIAEDTRVEAHRGEQAESSRGSQPAGIQDRSLCGGTAGGESVGQRGGDRRPGTAELDAGRQAPGAPGAYRPCLGEAQWPLANHVHAGDTRSAID